MDDSGFEGYREIKPINELDIVLKAPPSKAHSLRAIFISSLVEGKTRILNPLMGDDQKFALESIRCLGSEVVIEDDSITVFREGELKLPKEPIFVGESGVSARFLPSIVSTAPIGFAVIDGSKRMQTGRPITVLIDALKSLGVEIESLNGTGCVPVRVKGGTLKGGLVKMDGSLSSQYLSSVLLSSPFAKEEDVVIECVGKLSSKPYIEITLSMMEEFGVKVSNNNFDSFQVPCGQKYKSMDYKVEGDFSSSSFFFEAAAVTGGRVRVSNLREDSIQGDKFFLDCLEKMGCSVKWNGDQVEVCGTDNLSSIEVDMNNFPDIVTPLAVVAAFAKGTSKFSNIAHLKYKECDRLKAPVAELKKMGVDATCDGDSMTVVGKGTGDNVDLIKGALIETYNDHRMAMGFAVAGLVVPGMQISNPSCVKKSFPSFWSVFESFYKR